MPATDDGADFPEEQNDKSQAKKAQTTVRRLAGFSNVSPTDGFVQRKLSL